MPGSHPGPGRLARGRPPIEVELRPSGRSAAVAALGRGEVSAAILSAPFPPEFTTASRFHVPVGHLAVPAGDPLASAPVIRPERLTGHRVLVPRVVSPGGMWAHLAARLPGPYLHRVASDDIEDFAAALDLVAAGAGLLPVPGLLVRTIRRPDIRFVPLDAADLHITYGLTWPSTDASGELVTLIRTIQQALWTR